MRLRIPPTAALTAAGVSVWLDDLSRDRIVGGGLQRLVETRDVAEITTNPTIFANALAGDAYDPQLADLARRGVEPEAAVWELITTDVRDACDVLLPLHSASGGRDGWVSIEVEPGVAHDAEATVAEAERLRAAVARPNVFVKIPATDAGLVAIEEATARGLSINVTLIFGLRRYRAVIGAYLAGLRRAAETGIRLDSIRSTASLFLSRVDAAVDPRLAALADRPVVPPGSTAIAVARLAYAMFEHEFQSPAARELLAAGANIQRPLWASMGVKDATLPDTLYVTDLVAPDVVMTMPEHTLEAVADHGVIEPVRMREGTGSARAVVDAVEAAGIDLEEVGARHGLTLRQVIDLHAEGLYRVYMIGFLPGFAYLGGLDPRIATSRRVHPRAKIPASSIMIGGAQAGLAPMDMPSGWHLLGRTPVRSYAPERDPAFLFAAGDEIVFEPIDASHWERLEKAASAGEPVAEEVRP